MRRLRTRKMRSQPRVKGEDGREPKGSCFPHEVTKALRQMAWREGKSVSWIIAGMVYEYFGLDETGYHSKSERVTLKERLAIEHKRIMAKERKRA
jgi:hypothetical protein